MNPVEEIKKLANELELKLYDRLAGKINMWAMDYIMDDGILPQDIEEAYDTPDTDRTPEQKLRLLRWYQSTAPGDY